jgi:hypothetical protein
MGLMGIHEGGHGKPKKMKKNHQYTAMIFVLEQTALYSKISSESYTLKYNLNGTFDQLLMSLLQQRNLTRIIIFSFSIITLQLFLDLLHYEPTVMTL